MGALPETERPVLPEGWVARVPGDDDIGALTGLLTKTRRPGSTAPVDVATLTAVVVGPASWTRRQLVVTRPVGHPRGLGRRPRPRGGSHEVTVLVAPDSGAQDAGRRRAVRLGRPGRRGGRGAAAHVPDPARRRPPRPTTTGSGPGWRPPGTPASAPGCRWCVRCRRMRPRPARCRRRVRASGCAASASTPTGCRPPRTCRRCTSCWSSRSRTTSTPTARASRSSSCGCRRTPGTAGTTGGSPRSSSTASGGRPGR